MVNVYILKSTADTPDGFTEVAAGYRDRLVLLGATALTTGGSDTHNHTASLTSINCVCANQEMHQGTSIFDSNFSSCSPCAAWYGHNHLGGGSASLDTQNHLPVYKNFRCVYRSITGWDGTLPSGSIVFGDISANNWSTYDSGSTYFIRISATAGGTGGNTSHHHVASYQTNTHGTQYSEGLTSGGGGSGACLYHYHTGSIDSDTRSHAYYYYCNKMLLSSANDYVHKDMVLLFDGDPGGQWTLVNYSGYFLRNGASESSGGSFTSLNHNHANINVTTNSATGVTGYSTPASYIVATNSHTHTGVISSIQTQDVTPSYVKFLTYKANVNFPMGAQFQVIWC